MKRCAKVAALVLIIVGMTSALAAQLHSTSSPDEQPAGCHQHEKKSPVRRPADYKCCVVGHDAALLRSAAVPPSACQVDNAIPLAVRLVTEHRDVEHFTPATGQDLLDSAGSRHAIAHHHQFLHNRIQARTGPCGQCVNGSSGIR